MPESHTLEAGLFDLGFTSVGAREFQNEDVVAEVTDTWLTLSAPGGTASEGEDWLNRPGLWKRCTQPSGLVCDIPRLLLTGDFEPGGGGQDESSLSRVLGWAMATRHGEWQPELIDACEDSDVPIGSLTARAGALTCQGEVRDEGCRFWIDYRLADMPPDLPAAQEAWLDAQVRASSRYRMVRVSRAPGNRTLHARIDLTGLPSPVREALIAEAAPRLRATVERLLPAVALLTDGVLTSRALELGTPDCELMTTTTRKSR